MMITVLLYGSECWTLTKQVNRTERAEMCFLRGVAGYHLIDKKLNEDIRNKLH